MSAGPVSEIFDPTDWDLVPGFEFTDITYHRGSEVPAVRIAFNRPEVRNAFRPHTVDELYQALDHARQSSNIGCVLLTGNGPSLAIDPAQNNAFRAANQAWKSGASVGWAPGDSGASGRYVISGLTSEAQDTLRCRRSDRRRA